MSIKKTFSMGGLHIEKYKLSSSCPIEQAPLPPMVYIPVRQHIGKPAKVLVEKGSKVKVGTLLADSDGLISADVHSSVSGEVVKIDEVKSADGYMELMISIKVEGDEWEESIDQSPEIISQIPQDADTIKEAILQSGIVGMGGAGFPTPVKVSIPEGKKADTLIINGIECEPFLTADDRLMVEHAEEIVIGAKLINKLLGIQNAIIAIDENKAQAIEKLTHVCKRYVGVNVAVCKTKYPQGSEKQLIDAITGRQVPSGKLPIDVNCVVQNVGTVFAVYQAVFKHKPLFERVVTFSGDKMKTPRNLLVRVGTPVSFILEHFGENEQDADQIIFGGPMMGKSVVNTLAPVTKLTSGVLLLSKQLTNKEDEYACIRCAKCALSCPMGLEPFNIASYVKNNMIKETKTLRVTDCLECGCCSYICPSRIPLTDYCKLAKQELKKQK